MSLILNAVFHRTHSLGIHLLNVCTMNYKYVTFCLFHLCYVVIILFHVILRYFILFYFISFHFVRRSTFQRIKLYILFKKFICISITANVLQNHNYISVRVIYCHADCELIVIVCF